MTKSLHLFGVPYHIGCSEITASVLDSENGPKFIRAAVQALTKGFDIPLKYLDRGDISCDDSVAGLLQATEQMIEKILNDNAYPISLGGAHTYTLGSFRALKDVIGDYSLIYIDAHPDLMPTEEIYYGSTLHHAIQEKVLEPHRIGYVGIRHVDNAEWLALKSKEILYYEPTDIQKLGINSVIEALMKRLPPPYYISFDLDGIDPTFAPGVSTPYPFGMFPREVLTLAKAFCEKQLVGFEIVEHAPKIDQDMRTARLAAAFLLEITAHWSKNL